MTERRELFLFTEKKEKTSYKSSGSSSSSGKRRHRRVQHTVFSLLVQLLVHFHVLPLVSNGEHMSACYVTCTHGHKWSPCFHFFLPSFSFLFSTPPLLSSASSFLCRHDVYDASVLSEQGMGCSGIRALSLFFSSPCGWHLFSSPLSSSTQGHAFQVSSLRAHVTRAPVTLVTPSHLLHGGSS